MRVGSGKLAALDSLATPDALLVESVMSGPPPVCAGELSIRHASQLMTDHRALVVRGQVGWGVATDSDIRQRVVAAGLSPDRPIRDVMTFPARVVDPESSAQQVLLEMLETGIHHFPVVRKGLVVGMVSDLDVLSLERRAPFTLRDRLERARTAEDLVEAGREIPQVAADLWRAGLDGPHIGEWLSVLTDRLTGRLIDVGIERHGPPPLEWAWLALGSLGRREQALTADQDHALVYAEGGEAHDEYFQALADEVVTSLAAAGFPRCESRVMATETDWRMSLPAWLDRLDRWIASPDRPNVFLTGIVFDYRQIAGPLDVVSRIDPVIVKAGTDSRFVRRMNALALAHKSPLGFGGRLKAVETSGRLRLLDFKKYGLLPVTELARALAVGSGLSLRSTMDRLRRVAEDPEWSDAGASLAQVFRFMQHVRFRHQVSQQEAGLPPDDLVPTRTLDRLTRIQLRDAFSILRLVQNEVAFRWGITR